MSAVARAVARIVACAVAHSVRALACGVVRDSRLMKKPSDMEA